MDLESSSIPQPSSVGARVFEFWTEEIAPETFEVVRFRGVEEISRMFRFDVVLAVRGSAAELESDLVGARGTLSFQSGDTRRFVHGTIKRAHAEPSGGRGVVGSSRLRLTLVPGVWRLGRNQKSRIFQDLSVRDVVDRVLADNNAKWRWSLDRTLAARTYCVQHEESDLAFIRRLLAEEGVFFHFEHAEDGVEELVFADAAHAAVPIDGIPTIHYAEDAGLRERERIDRFRVEHRVRPGKVLLRDFDFARPSLDLSAGAESADEKNGARDILVYDHHGEFEGDAIDDAAAQRRLEQHRARGVVGVGESRSTRLMPGRWFELVDSPAPEHDGRYTVFRVEHEGSLPEATGASIVYSNRFSSVPSTVTLRPRRPPRRIHQVIETATVVGPAGHEIHTDSLGRVRVHFHWDRDPSNEASSCWIRTMQTWGGAGWGTQFIPRVGMEVLVAFVGGDVDKPMILGSAYNAGHPPPFQLPQQKTKSGIRTQSSKGGGGYNELSFEDKKGREQIFLRAERDLEIAVGANKTTRVVGNATDQVSGNRFAVVTGNVLASVAGNVTQSISGSDALAVEGDRNATIGGNEIAVVSGNAHHRVAEDLNALIGKRERHEVKNARDVIVGGDQTVNVAGCATVVVGKHDAKRMYVLHVEGASDLTSTGKTEISADAGLTLRCGETAIHLTSDTIEIDAATIVLKGTGTKLTFHEQNIKVHAESKITLVADDKAVMKGSGAVVVLDDDAKINGGTVKLKNGDGSIDDDDPTTTDPTTIVLADKDGNPIPNQRYRIELDSGDVLTGILDADGQAKVRFDGSGHITFPGLGALEES